MRLTIWGAVIVAVLGITGSAQQATSQPPAVRTQHPTGGHPDLSGIWSFTIDLPPGALKKQAGGVASIEEVDRGVVREQRVPGALPYTPAPSYKPEFQEKVKYLSDHENKLDQVFYCGKPGVPRIGPPRKIVQLPNEMIFLYEDISGDPYRIIPTDGRPHRADADPTYYGDSVGHWEGNRLVVDVTNFVEDTWFGENGYFHSDAMHVTERFWRDGANLVYQVTVEDPKVLTAPWTMRPRVVKPSTDPLEESPRCVESDGSRLTNNDHHVQR
ncbi:MAG TPA: hypothetical protein VJ732_12275 [Bryobacteraceae bacterium]|nr:hypothetical protein [Bryobacteraceae bacterium]